MKQDKIADKDIIDELISEDTDVSNEIDIDIDEDEKEIYDTKLSAKIERIKKKISLEGKRERKIQIDHNVVEDKINEFVKKYQIEERIDQFVNNEIDQFQNSKNEAKIIEHANSDDYDDLLFSVDVFEKIDKYTKQVVRAALEKELARADLTDTDRTILGIIDTHVELTLSDAGIDKLTLVAFHHFLKNLEIRAKKFIYDHIDELYNFNKQKTATHLYRKEVIYILSNHPQLAAFSMTIVSLVSSWLEKYKQKSIKLSKFLSELMLMTSDVIVDKIARYILLIAIKNSSPIKFRSIFSTYLSLIHRNISSMLSANITNVKLGYFAKMQYLFDDNENQRVYNRHQMLANALLRAIKLKNRKNFKSINNLREEILPFLSLNLIDYMLFNDPKFNILDSFYVYNMYGKYIQNGSLDKANKFVFSSNIVPRRNTTSIKHYLEMKINEQLRPVLEQYIKDEMEVTDILYKLRMYISREINPKIYFDEDGVVNNIDINELYKEMDLIVEKSIRYLQKKD